MGSSQKPTLSALPQPVIMSQAQIVVPPKPPQIMQQQQIQQHHQAPVPVMMMPMRPPPMMRKLKKEHIIQFGHNNEFLFYSHSTSISNGIYAARYATARPATAATTATSSASGTRTARHGTVHSNRRGTAKQEASQRRSFISRVTVP